MLADADPLPYVHLSKPNRSLGLEARRWVLAGISTMTLGVAVAATAFGAWPVMPFAGIEVGVLMLAFRALGKHDADFERLEIHRHEVSVEVREAQSCTRFVAHLPWARVVMRERGARCTLRLAYAGRTVPLGRMLSDEGRRRLAENLRGKIAVTTN